MTQEVKIMIGIAAATVVLVVGAALLLGNDATKAPVEIAKKLSTKTNRNTVGSPSAKVTIVEFADFQCPACAAAHPATKEIIKEYNGKIYFVFKHFPLLQHKNAMIAANTAEAAGAQGKFWEMQDLLYEHQTDWAENDNPLPIFTQYAKSLKLDEEKFTKAVTQKAYEKLILVDRSEGNTLGVNSTPTFFINGEKNPGVLSLEEFKNKIDPLLK